MVISPESKGWGADDSMGKESRIEGVGNARQESEKRQLRWYAGSLCGQPELMSAEEPVRKCVAHTSALSHQRTNSPGPLNTDFHQPWGTNSPTPTAPAPGPRLYVADQRSVASK